MILYNVYLCTKINKSQFFISQITIEQYHYRYYKDSFFGAIQKQIYSTKIGMGNLTFGDLCMVATFKECFRMLSLVEATNVR